MTGDRIDWNKGNGILPAVIQNAENGQVLIVGYLNIQSWALTLESQEVHFFSRSRQRIWRKGETSGNILRLQSWSLDCDGDSFLLMVCPSGPTCHTGEASCFTEKAPAFPNLAFLEKVVDWRWREAASAESYVARLRERGISVIAQKLGEEAVETVIASLAPKNQTDFIEESSDLFFHWLVLARSLQVPFSVVVENLKKRSEPKRLPFDNPSDSDTTRPNRGGKA
jgi:phosphoribosyl-ATP pyrophosphohydrolase/phosphoribosyl-AMP cyclohydrolase